MWQWGLKQLLNRIPYEDAVSIRIQLVGHYGKTGYYRFYRGERGLMPKDQAYIRQLFRNKGIKEEPTTNATQKNIFGELLSSVTRFRG